MSTTEIEYRDLIGSFEVKADNVITGLASPFGEVDSYGDTVAPGAYANTITQRGSVPMLWSHDAAQPIGVWNQLEETQAGLRVRGKVTAGTQKGSEALALVKDGAVSGLSIGFRSRGDRIENGVRVLSEIDLLEISLVTIPAADSARIDARNLQTQADVERLLKSAGVPGRAARKIAEGGWPALRGNNPTDAEIAAELRALAQSFQS